MNSRFTLLFIRRLSFIIMGFLPTYVYAQVQYVQFKPLDVDDGLLHNEVNVMIQDFQGFMWLGTKAGLVRYDGYDFVEHLADNTDSTRLYSPGIEYLFEDSRQNLWIICGFAPKFFLHKYDRDLEQFQLIKGSFNQCWNMELTPVMVEDEEQNIWLRTCEGLTQIKTDDQISSREQIVERLDFEGNSVNSLSLDHVGNLWIGTDKGLYQKPKDSQKFEHVNSEVFGELSITAIEETDEGDLALGTKNQGLWIFNPEDGQVKQFVKTTNETGLSGNHILKIRKDYKGFLWIRTVDFSSRLHGLDRFDAQVSDFRSYAVHTSGKGRVHNVLQSVVGRDGLYIDRKGYVWIFTLSGIERYDYKGDFFYELRSLASQNYENFLTFYEDRTGKFWVSYRALGLLTYAPSVEKIKHIPAIPNDPYSVAHGIVVDVHEDQLGNIWVGSYEGLDKIEIDDKYRVKSLTRFKHDPNNPNSLTDNRIFEIMEDREGFIWLNIGFYAVNRLDPRTDNVIRYVPKPVDSNQGTMNSILNIAQAAGNALWIGSRGEGLHYLDYSTWEFRNYQHNPENPNSVSANYCSPTQIDNHGRVWLASTKGINVFYPSEERFDLFLPDANFGLNQVYYNDTDSVFWVKSGHGLYKHSIKLDSTKLYSIYDGLITEELNGIIPDNKGRLWISSNQGIMCLDPKTDEITSYGIADGLPSLQFAYGPVAKRKNGEIMFGLSGEGFVIFHPDSLQKNTLPPQIAITGFQLFNTPVSPNQENGILQKSINQTEKIILNHDQNVIGFTYAALHYASSSHNQYKYKMEGVDPNWNEVGTQRIANYAGLQPGKYTFEVQASNSDGIWNEAGKSIQIIIRYPWWQRWWAWGIYSIIFLGLLWLGREELIRRERLKADFKLQALETQKLQEVDRLKTQFFANISHEFRTPLTLIIGPIQRMLSDTFQGNLKDQYKVILRNGQRLLHLINQLLDLSKLEADEMKLRAAREDIVSFLRTLIAAFESRAEARNMQLSFEADAEEIWLYFDRDKMEKILINLMSNAFKFTPDGGRISIQLTGGSKQDSGNRKNAQLSTANCLLLTVKDTGIGIKKERLPYIFDRFYQVDDSQTRRQEGTGIGLALVKELVQLHHGKITAQSEVGKGTTFELTLPVGKDHLKEEEIVARSGYKPIKLPEIDETQTEVIPSTTKAGKNPVLLIVEDNPDMRTYLIENLENNFQIKQAPNGRKGLEIALEEVPDLIISDIMMPEMDGQELCRRLKTDERTSHIPVVLLTAKAGERAKIAGLQTGADDYITKPFSPVELRVRTQNLIEQRELLRQRFSQNIYLKPKELAITSADEQFLQKVMSLVEEHMSDFDFGVDAFVKALGLSRQQVYRKLKALVDQSPSVFIRSIRLKRAAQLLEQPRMIVSEAMYEAGFSNHAYFSQQFKAQFGMTPSEYREGKQLEE